MSVVLITGSSGLVGSEAVSFFCKKGFDVVGIDNNLRKFFFGNDWSTLCVKKNLKKKNKNFINFDIDIRNNDALNKIFNKYKKRIKKSRVEQKILVAALIDQKGDISIKINR